MSQSYSLLYSNGPVSQGVGFAFALGCNVPVRWTEDSGPPRT